MNKPPLEKSLLIKNEKLAEEWHPTLNGDLTPADVFPSENRKRWWLCKECGNPWLAVTNSRNQGRGCRYCAKFNKRVLAGHNDLATTNKELAEEWHPILNGDLKPTDVLATSENKVWWLGKCRHEWQAQVCTRNKGIGCGKCDREFKTSFKEQAIYFYLKETFDDTVNTYRFSDKAKLDIDVYIGNLNLGIEFDGYSWHKNPKRDLRKNLLCKESGITLIRVREKDCPILNDGTYCIFLKDNTNKSLENAIEQIYTYITENITFVNYFLDIDIDRDSSNINNLFIQKRKNNNLLIANPPLAAEWHPTENGRLTADMFAPNSNTTVSWLCKSDHKWKAQISSRNNGNGCPICDGKEVLKGFNDLATLNKSLAEEWHPTRNENITPEMRTANSNKKALWLCKKCKHEWEAVISSRNSSRGKGSGCPRCSGKILISGFNDLATMNLELAKEWHSTLNAKKASEVHFGSNERAWWKCSKCNHEWATKICHRSKGNKGKGSGCPKRCKTKYIIPHQGK